jgi:hypothetical protein
LGLALPIPSEFPKGLSQYWYGTVATSNIAEVMSFFGGEKPTVYSVPIGSSNAKEVKVGVAKYRYQIHYKGEPINGASWTDKIYEYPKPPVNEE